MPRNIRSGLGGPWHSNSATAAGGDYARPRQLHFTPSKAARSSPAAANFAAQFHPRLASSQRTTYAKRAGKFHLVTPAGGRPHFKPANRRPSSSTRSTLSGLHTQRDCAFRRVAFAVEQAHRADFAPGRGAWESRCLLRSRSPASASEPCCPAVHPRSAAAAARSSSNSRAKSALRPTRRCAVSGRS